jgi:hypothetical protein
MNLTLLRQVLNYDFLNVLRNRRIQNYTPTPHASIDAFQLEIYQIEQSLREMATRPSPRVKHPRPLTEQQKIIDLAG